MIMLMTPKIMPSKLKKFMLNKHQRYNYFRKIIHSYHNSLKIYYFRQDAEMIRNNAIEAKKEVENLYSEANNLHTRISNTGSRFESLEEIANKDDSLSEIAKAKVGQAKTDSDEVQTKMQKALDDIKGIIADLENMREISMSDIDELGKKFNFPRIIRINLTPFYRQET
jgi:methyl-accepting chemotaxis protein